MLVSGLVIALYFWAFFAGVDNVNNALLVSDIAASAAGTAFLGAAISYLWSPRHYILATSLILFIVLAAMIALLLLDTDLTNSPFIALWMLLAVFAPVLGIYGTGVIILGTAGFIIHEQLSGTFGIDDLVVTAFVAILPLIIGYLVWPARISAKSETSEDRSYHELASELSTVSGQSEIVIAAIADGVISINAKGEVQLINPAAQKMIGWGKSDALGLNYKSVLKMVDGRDQPLTDANDPVQKALTTNTEASCDTNSIITGEAGKKFLASITASPVGSMGSGLIIVFRDITKERVEEREQAEFISTASHEMRTPVASIEGYLGLALNPATAQIDDKAREFITKAHESAQHLGRLFQDLLDVSKADDGRLSNNPRVIDVVAFVGDIIQGQTPKATDKGLRINYKPLPDGDAPDRYEATGRIVSPIYYVKVDSDHLREIINNLVENAIKYTPKGSVEIDVTGDDTAIIISIKDSGIGIPQEDIPHLFQKFYRVDNSDTREIGGTGLGLYLCRKLVEAIGGKIWVESTYKQGSIFFVKLPRLDTVSARHEIEAAGEAEPTEIQEPTITPSVPATPVLPVAAAPPPPTPVMPAPAIIATAPANIAAPPVPAATPTPAATSVVPSPSVSAPAPATTPVPAPVQPPQTTIRVPPRATSTGPAAPVFRPGETRPSTPLDTIGDGSKKYVGAAPQIPPRPPAL